VRVEPGKHGVHAAGVTYYPWSHRLLMALVWSALAGAGYWL